jgi:lipopolysaccharide/colanic/teichoic acid biosynthesis glycosyltransferase
VRAVIGVAQVQRLPPAHHEQLSADRDGTGERWRRVLNILAALTGIVLTAPLMLIIALLVKVTSPGPVLYRQVRVGINRRQRRGEDERHVRQQDRGGRLFTMYKFRTMYQQTRAVQRWASPDDPRITPLGGIFRKFRIDELPQLFNVLHGDMNVVGPRPEQPDIFVNLREQIDTYSWRQEVPPGITGWAQIKLPYDRTIDDARRKLELDLDYIRRKSTVYDLTIMVRTLPAMLGRRGAL